jgi:ABC-type Zn2+ transport system substrate-binding protein/surface adhesin
MSNKIGLKKIKNSTNILHPDTGLVFRSQKDKVVIGRFEDNEVISLVSSDIDLCRKWKFKYDKDLVEQDENGENEVDEEDQDQDEEEDEEEDRTNEEKEDVNETHHDHHENNNQDIDLHTQNDTIKTEYIMDLTNNFSKQLYSSFDLLHQTYLEQISEYKNKLVEVDRKFDNLSKQHQDECNNHKDTEEELNNLKTKFNGIKNLFSM